MSKFSKKQIRNKIRSCLLIDTQNDLKQKNNSTLINSQTSKDFEDKIFESIFIEIKQKFDSPKIEKMSRLLQIFHGNSPKNKLSLKNIIESNIDEYDSSDINCDLNDFNDFTTKRKQSISKRKLNHFKYNNLGQKKALSPEERALIKDKLISSTEKRNLNFYKKKNRNENKTLTYEDKIQDILDYLNLEKAFFMNINTQLRSKASFFYLRNLCGHVKNAYSDPPFDGFSLSKSPKYTKKDIKAFSEVENIMLLKENINDKSFISHGKEVTKSFILNIHSKHIPIQKKKSNEISFDKNPLMRLNSKPIIKENLNDDNKFDLTGKPDFDKIFNSPKLSIQKHENTDKTEKTNIKKSVQLIDSFFDNSDKNLEQSKNHKKERLKSFHQHGQTSSFIKLLKCIDKDDNFESKENSINQEGNEKGIKPKKQRKRSQSIVKINMNSTFERFRISLHKI